MDFLHPGLLAGAALFAVPLVIHLLNRQRYRRRRWAAMEFLLNAYKKQRRRLRTENLLLLLLRCLIPVVLALAIARPVLRNAPAIASLGGSAHHILVLDASYSMDLRPEGAPSPFQRMKTLCAKLLERLEGRPSQKVTIVLCGIRPRMPVRADMNLSRAKATIAALAGPEDSAADLTAGLLQVAEEVEQAPENDIRVYVLTDLQRRAFGEVTEEPEGGGRPPDHGAEPSLFEDTARDAFERISRRARVVLLDVGGQSSDTVAERADNIQIVDVRLGRAHAVARVPVPITVRVLNRTDRSRVVEVTLEIEGAAPTRKSLTVEAGAEAEVEMLVTFRKVGLSFVQASIEDDGLATDNERSLVVDVRERLRLLLVDGARTDDPTLRDSEPLRSVLDPTGGEGPPELTVFWPKVVDTTEFLLLREDLRRYDAIALCNVDRLTESAAEALTRAVESGVGLLVMLGDRTDVDRFNELLGMKEGLMPLRLIGTSGFQPGGSRHYLPAIARPDHAIFTDFASDPRLAAAFEFTPVYRYVDAEVTDSRRALVLAQVRDADLSPLLVASRYRDGKTLFLTSAISRRPDRWNRFEWLGIAIPLFHQAAYWLTLPANDPFNVPVGAPLTASLRHRPRDVAVLLPERAGQEKVLVAEEPRVLPGGRFALPAFRDTRYAGVYTVEAKLEADGQTQPEMLYFAVDPDPAEGDLVYLSHREAKERLGVEQVVRGLPAEAAAAADAGSSDLGLPLLYAALLLLLGEGAMARWVSRRRS